MGKRVLLVYPEIPATYWSFKYTLPFIDKRAAFPPLGLLTVAALLPGNYHVTLIDMNVTPLREKDILDSDLIFISSMIVQRESLERVIKLCNELQKPVVAGGPYPTSSFKKIQGVDHFVLNEAEVTLIPFIRDFERGRTKRVYRSDRKPDLKKIPVPRFDLIDMSNYTSMAIQYSRGCPFNCEFCDIIEMYGRIPRTKSPAQLINEMEALYGLGYRGSLFIVDDNFIGNKRNVKVLLGEIIEWQQTHGYPFAFFTEASINLADDNELMDLMAQAGFNMVFIGIETPVEETLSSVQKTQNTRVEMLSCINAIQKKGMEVSAGFIVGFDNDPINIFDLQIDFIQRSSIPMAMIGLLIALPNTQLYRRLASEQRIIDEASGNNTHDLQLNFIPRMDINKLIEGYKRIITEVYRPVNYFQRCLRLLKKLPRLMNSTGEITMSKAKMGLRALVFSLFAQTFSNYGVRYIAYLIKSLITKPLLFPKAVKLAIMGHHFFRITREIIAADNFKNYLGRCSHYLKDKMERIAAGNVDDLLGELISFQRSTTARVQRMYRGIHRDFHNYIEKSLMEYADNLHIYFDRVTNRLHDRVREIVKNNIDGGFSELKALLERFIFTIRKRYQFLHKDLKKYLGDAIISLERALKQIINEMEKQSN